MKELRTEIEVLHRVIDELREEANRADRKTTLAVVAWEIFRADRTISPEDAELRAAEWIERGESR